MTWRRVGVALVSLLLPLAHVSAQPTSPTAPEAARNADADYPYRHDSYFYYLSGFTEPEAVIV